ncbi:hypothetical protein D3C84_483310 [compost metagenome]
MTRIGVDIVGAKSRLHEFVGGITFPDGPLPGAEHRDRLGALVFQRLLELQLHHIEGLFPGNRLELALLVIAPVRHAQQGLGQTIHPVHDLGQKVALDAVQATVDLGFHITVGRHHPVVLGRDHHTATGAAKAARGLVPVQGDHVLFSNQVAGRSEHRKPGSGRSNPGSLGLDEFAPSHRHAFSPVTSSIS